MLLFFEHSAWQLILLYNLFWFLHHVCCVSMCCLHISDWISHKTFKMMKLMRCARFALYVIFRSILYILFVHAYLSMRNIVSNVFSNFTFVFISSFRLHSIKTRHFNLWWCCLSDEWTFYFKSFIGFSSPLSISLQG